MHWSVALLHTTYCWHIIVLSINTFRDSYVARYVYIYDVREIPNTSAVRGCFYGRGCEYADLATACLVYCSP